MPKSSDYPVLIVFSVRNLSMGSGYSARAPGLGGVFFLDAVKLQKEELSHRDLHFATLITLKNESGRHGRCRKTFGSGFLWFRGATGKRHLVGKISGLLITSQGILLRPSPSFTIEAGGPRNLTSRSPRPLNIKAKRIENVYFL